MLTVPSYVAVANFSPDGEKATPQIGADIVTVCVHLPELRSQILSCLSIDPVMKAF